MSSRCTPETLLSRSPWHRLAASSLSPEISPRATMPTRHSPVGHHVSKLQAADCAPGDELEGGWPREDMLKMDARFCAAMERAIKLGMERRPQEAAARAA